ncbi:MAG: hypothetical protein ACPLXP_02435 [Microgenomates group bacterium]
MPKKLIPQNIAQQLKQLGEGVFETVKKQPEELAGKALEQLGVGGSPAGSQKTPSLGDEAKKLAEMKAADEVKSQQQAARIIRELEEEIEKWRRIREEQLKARRQPPQEQQQEKQGVSLLVEPSTKPKRGWLFGFWSRRAQRAREQAQPEMVGRRVGG